MDIKNRNKKEALLQMIKEDPNDPFLRFALAKEYEKANDIAEAKKLYILLTTEHVDYVGTYYHYGMLLAANNEKDDALSIYSKGIAIARSQNDQHSASELMNAKMNLEIE